jgi:hypothetical protein
MAKNNDGPGPIQPKSGENLKAIDRMEGIGATMTALHDSTKSQYPHVDKHYCYEALGDLDGSLHLPPAGYVEKPAQGTYP